MSLRSPRTARQRLVFALCLMGAAAATPLACDRVGGSEAVYPEATAYDGEVGFVGTWRGTVGERQGLLRLGELSPRRYFGNFAADNGNLEIALLLDQSLVSSVAGAAAPSNRVLFTWQDGDGERGHGWLIISADGGRIDGASGPLELIKGRDWSLVREAQTAP